MAARNRRITTCFLATCLLLSSCVAGQLINPTITSTAALTRTSTPSPTPTLRPTPAPLKTPVPVPPTDEPFGIVGQIGGSTQAVAVAGNFAYVGVGFRLVALDVSDPGVLREVGSSEPFGSYVEDVSVVQETAYVVAGGSGLYIVDISDPAQPTFIGNYDTLGYAESVTVRGMYAYVADGPDGLRVIDITDRDHPTEVSVAYKLNYAFDVAIDDGYAFVAAAGAGLLIADVSDPLQPKETGSLDTPGNAFGISLSGGVAYVADGWDGLRVVDVSTPAQPEEIGSYDTQGWALDVAAAGKIAYVAFAFMGLQILDVSAPAQPTPLGNFDMLGDHVGNLAISEGTVYVTSRNTGLRILDVATPTEPVRIGFYNPMGFADAVAVSGSYAYVAAGPYGLRIVDISDLTHPREVGAYETGSYAAGVVIAGNYAYVITLFPVALIETGLHVVDVSDPTHPTKVSFLPNIGAPRDLVIQNEILYIADERGLLLIDVSNPYSPTQLSLLVFGQGDVTSGVAVSEDMAYVTHSIGGLMVADVSNPRKPGSVAIYKSDTVNKVLAVTLGGKFAYVTDHPRVHIVDISNPAKPTEAGFYDLPVAAEQVKFANERLYVADSGGGLVVLDVADPAHPSLAGWQRLPGNAFGLTAADNYIYVADGEGGLFIIEDTAKPEQTSLTPLSLSREATVENESISLMPPVQARNFLSSIPVRQVSLTTRWQAEPPAGDLRTDLFEPTVFQPGASTLTVTSTADDGQGTLRWAMQTATSGDTITFDPEIFPPDNPATIYPSTNLPGLGSGNVTIDASNAGVVLNGSRAKPGAKCCLNGLTISSDNNVIRGLQIVNFADAGVLVVGGYNIVGGDRTRGTGPMGEGNLISGNGWAGVNLKEPRAVGNKVIGNYIGTDLTGIRAMGNQISGVELAAYASQNIVGGPTEWERNVISGNDAAEIHIVAQGNGNTIEGNYIGIDASGQARLGNAGAGVLIELGGFNNIIQANVIGGGVTISDWGSWGNEIIGNFIGVDATGSVSLGSPSNGIGVGPSFNRIGGTKPGERNIISGNGGNGIRIGLWGTTDIFVIGNYVGTDVTGTKAIPNSAGIGLFGSRHTFIGGVSEGEKNLISGNYGDGISVEGIGNDFNFVIGNYIGTDAGGSVALPNREGGVEIKGGGHNFMQGNLIGFNEKSGIFIASGDGNQIYHNTLIQNNAAFDGGTGNSWDNGGEGNYWSDYSGKDQDGDGIGDTPYKVLPNGVDNFPLIEPYITYEPPEQTLAPSGSSKTSRSVQIIYIALLEAIGQLQIAFSRYR